MKKKIVSFIRKHPIFSGEFAVLFFIVLIPALINFCYSWNHVFYVTQWGAADVLAYYGSILGAFVTLSGLAVTITITRKQIQRESFLNRENEKWKAIESCFASILKEIDPVDFLKITSSIDMQNPHAAITQMQVYQMTCRTATNRLTPYLSILDYPKVESLIKKITAVSEKLFQIANEESSELSKCYTILIANNSKALLKNLIELSQDDSSEEVQECKKAIAKADGMSFEQIQDSIGKKNQELVDTWENEYYELLQLKGQTLESIYAQVENDADAILRFGRKKECQPSNGSEKTK